MKTVVIYHRADFDGLFCREIARKFLPDAELIGWDYGDSDAIVPPDVENIYMLDISVEAWMTDPRLVWIDHHKSAMEKFHHGIPGYRIDGVAACRLAWQWFSVQQRRERTPCCGYASPPDRPYCIFWNEGNKVVQCHNCGEIALPEGKGQYYDRIISEPLAVRLAGEYDIWDKRDERVDVFQFGLRSRELSGADWADMLSTRKATIDEIESLAAIGHQGILNPDGTHVSAVVWQLLEAGKILQAYQQRNDAGMMHRSFLVEFEGLKFLALTTARCNSLTFASKDIPETGHDALMGFYYTGTKWGVSLYHAKHRTDLDLSIIAVKHGGGGHRGACGFQAATLPFLR